MKVATAAQMREIDRRAIKDYHLPGIVLMEAAGQAFANVCQQVLGGDVRGKHIAMVCGGGGNGGDGFVAARHLKAAGAEVQVFLAGKADALRGDAAVHYAPLYPSGISVHEITGIEDFKGPSFDLPYALIGDALLGTGARPVVESVYSYFIEFVNNHGEAGIPIVACDIPSGVNADTGAVDGWAVEATHTVTFALPKPGLLLFPGADHAGQITLAPIGMPLSLLNRINPALTIELTTHDWMRMYLPPRFQSRDANKGAFGTLLVIAGAAGMAGAASLVALSGLRAGAGLVYLAVPESLLDTAAALAPEAVLHGLPETPQRTHGGPGALEAALALAAKCSAVAIGPGMGGNPDAVSFVQALWQQVDKPLVIDADGLNALSALPTDQRKRGDAPTVLTPHPGEMGRLLGISTADVQADRLAAARRCARQYNAVTLLKGSRTLVADPTGEVAINRKGTPALATAGSGDVLTGVIGAYLSQQKPGMVAARAGAYVHALAGEIAASEIGGAGIIAGDVRDRIPRARQRLYSDETLDEL